MQQATILLLPALNQMIDITTTRTMATRVHPPEVTYVLLFALTVASGLLDQAGLDEAERRYELLMALGEALLNLAGDFKSTFLEAAAIRWRPRIARASATARERGNPPTRRPRSRARAPAAGAPASRW